MHDITTLRAALAGPLAPLAQYQQFMLWRLEDDGRKMPYALDGWSSGSSTNAALWGNATDALDSAERHGMGVAFCFTDNDPLRFIDIDHAFNDGVWSADALAICARFPGAAVELSQSGTGLHLFMTGPLPERHSNKRGGLEFYQKGRFCALTGAHARGDASWNGGESLCSFVAERFPPGAAIESDGGGWNVGPIADWQGPEDDNELLALFMAEAASRYDPAVAFGDMPAISNLDVYTGNSAVLSTVFAPDKPGEPYDRSRVDMSLAMRLARWTGKDAPRIERLMRTSALCRDKWDEPWNSALTRVQHDIVEACGKTSRVVRIDVAPELAMPLASGPANVAVVNASNDAYERYAAEVSDAGSVIALKEVTAEISQCASIDQTLRLSLAADINNRSKILLGNAQGWSLTHCKALIALRVGKSAPDRQAMQREINKSLNLADDVNVIAPSMSIPEMVDEYVYISRGKITASLYNRHNVYKLDEFRERMAGSVTAASDGSGRTANNVDLWMRSDIRKTVDTRTFRAGSPIFTSDPDGASALNLWRPIIRGPYISVDIAPFLEQINYLFGADAETFLDWLAHIEQKPGELPHFGWLHIANGFGTGRNWLSSVLSRLWRGYVAPSLDLGALINSNYNGVIAGRVIAIVDEIREGAKDDAYLVEGKIRNMLTAESRMINPKFGGQYEEYNACRWLLFSNHKNAIPINEDDRRWWVCHLALPPRDESVYVMLYGLLGNAAFIDSIGLFLRARDISHFNPGMRPPASEAKRAAVNATKSEYRHMADMIVKYWPSDFISWADVKEIMQEGDSHAKINMGAIRHAMEDVGMERKASPVRMMDNTTVKVWIVRDVKRWNTGDRNLPVTLEVEKINRQFGLNAYRYLLELSTSATSYPVATTSL